jgi:hypothetical protein
MEKNVQLKYRLYRRRNGVFYWQDNSSQKQGTLRTTDRREAERLLNAMNESHRQPTLNLNLARAYLAAHHPKMAQRTWQTVMDEMATHGIPSTQSRCARGFRSKAYHPVRNRPLVQTTGEDLPTIIHANGNCVAHYLPRLHNLALDLGWLPWPILAKRAWPKIRSQSKRAITAQEHTAVIASEKNPERRTYYELLYETGAAQTDCRQSNRRRCRLAERRSYLPAQKTRATQRTLSTNDWKKTSSSAFCPSTLWRSVSRHQTIIDRASVCRISPQVPSCRNYWRQLAQLSLCLGTARKGVRIPTALRPRSARAQQSRCSRNLCESSTSPSSALDEYEEAQADKIICNSTRFFLSR